MGRPTPLALNSAVIQHVCDAERSAETPRGVVGSAGGQSGGVVEEPWNLVARRRRRMRGVDARSVAIWGVPRGTSLLALLQVICQPRGCIPPGAVSNICWKGSQKQRLVLLTLVSSLARDARLQAIQKICRQMRWKALAGRTYDERQKHREPTATNDSHLPPATGTRGNPGYYSPLALNAALKSPPERVVSRGQVRPGPHPGPRTRRGSEGPRLKIGALNVQGGLLDKVAELDSHLRKGRFDIVIVSETRMRLTSKIKSKGFKFISFPNEDGTGGIGFLVSLVVAPLVSRMKSTTQNQGWICVKGSGAGMANLYIGGAYMPQESATQLERTTAWNLLRQSVNKYQAQGEVVVGGDLNAQVGRANTNREAKTIGTFTPAKRTANGQLLVDLLLDCGMVSLAGHVRPRGEPAKPGFWYTRYDSRHDTYSQIDHILVGASQHSRGCDRFRVDYTHLDSDHHLLSAFVCCPRRPMRPKPRRHKRFLLEKLCRGGRGSEDDVEKETTKYVQALDKVFGEYPSTVAQAVGDAPGAEIGASVVGDFVGKLERALESSVGSKTISKRYSRPWFDKSVSRAIARRRDAYRALKAKPTQEKWAKFCELRKEARALVRSRKQEEWDKVVKDLADSYGAASKKRFWSGLARFLPGKARKGTTPIRKAGGGLALTEEEREEAWVDHQASLGAESQDDCFDNTFFRNVEDEVAQHALESPLLNEGPMDAPFTEEEIREVMERLPTGKAAGLDKVRNESLKAGGTVLLHRILALFNWINSTEKVPVDWGRSLVLYIYKKGDRTLPGNYRGISLISCLGKIYLALWAKRISGHLELNCLSEEQGGFRPHRSTTEQVYVLNETLLRRRRAGKTTFCFFIDFRKAFDTVWHAGLWKRMWDSMRGCGRGWDSGIRGKAWRVIRSLYRNLQSSVLVDGRQTRFVPLHQGVRQGCPLSPSLFTCFIQELADRLAVLRGGVITGGRQLKSLLYADDVVLLAETADDLQNMMDVVDTFCRQWRMNLNLDKSRVMVVSPSKTPPQQWSWSIRGEPVPIVSEFQYLGVWLTNKLLWDRHIGHIIGVGWKRLAHIQRLLRIRELPLRLKISIWTTLGRATLEYGSELWTCNDVQAASLESIQHSALTGILLTNRKANRLALRAIAGVPSLKTRRGRRRLKFLARLLQKSLSTWARHTYETEPHKKSKVIGRSQKHWRSYMEAFLLQQGLEQEFGQLLHEVEANSGLLSAELGENTPLSAWRQSIRAWASRQDLEEVRRAVNASRNSTLKIIERVLQGDGARPTDRINMLLSAPPGAANRIRVRLLTGTSSLNGMMSRITRSTSRRCAICPLCEQSEETVEHFLWQCDAPSMRAARSRFKSALNSVSFEALGLDGKCGFILGCTVDDVKASTAQDAECLRFVQEIWTLRKTALTTAMSSAASTTSSPSSSSSPSPSSTSSPSPLPSPSSSSSTSSSRRRQTRIEDFFRGSILRPGWGVEAHGFLAMPQ